MYMFIFMNKYCLQGNSFHLSFLFFLFFNERPKINEGIFPKTEKQKSGLNKDKHELFK